MEFCMSLATNLMLQEFGKEKAENIVTSPLSLNVLLNMVTAGTEGRTMEQLLGALGSENEELNLASSKMLALFECILEKVGPTMSIANGVWVDGRCPMKPSYKKIATEVYKAHVQTVDFVRQPNEVIKKVNSWVEKATKGLIKDMLQRSDLDSDTALILGNALYFKGSWELAFKKSRTLEEEFHLHNGETIKVPFMKSENNEQHYYGSFDDFQLVKLPYKCGRGKLFSMFVFLPLEKNGLENLIQKLHDDPLLYRHCDNLQKGTLFKMWLPKFKFMYKFEPSDIMKAMGINLPFSPVGDLTAMVESSPDEPVYVNKIIQQSFIEVNEEGTEAAAATLALHVFGCSMDYKPPVLPSFVADHPFVFIIKEEESGAMFFTGAVFNPL